MGGFYPTEVDLYVFRQHPRFIVSYGQGIEAYDQLLSIKTQWTSQADRVCRVEIDPCHWFEGDIEFMGRFILGLASSISVRRHDDLFPNVVSTSFQSETPHRLIHGGENDDCQCYATLYPSSALERYFPILRQDCLVLRPGGAKDRDGIETIIEWVRVCALTQCWLGVLTLGQ
jgi:hypothetical protein